MDGECKHIVHECCGRLWQLAPELYKVYKTSWK